MANGPLVRAMPNDNTILAWKPRRLLPNQFAQLEVLFVPRSATTNAGLGMTVVNGETTATTSGRIAIIDPTAVASCRGRQQYQSRQQPATKPWQSTWSRSTCGQWPSVLRGHAEPNRRRQSRDFSVGREEWTEPARQQRPRPVGFARRLGTERIERDGVAVAAVQGERGVYSLLPRDSCGPTKCDNSLSS